MDSVKPRLGIIISVGQADSEERDPGPRGLVCLRSQNRDHKKIVIRRGSFFSGLQPRV